MKKTNKKGFTLIELLTVIAILAVILLIAAPTILGVLDKARKNTFKNQVLLYVEGLKSQTALAAMGKEYSDLAKNVSTFYAPTSDTTATDHKDVVKVSIANMNSYVMDNAVLKDKDGDNDTYLYVQHTANGYNYYIGQNVQTEGGYKTTCPTTDTNSTCVDVTVGTDSAVKVIKADKFSTDHIVRNDR